MGFLHTAVITTSVFCCRIDSPVARCVSISALNMTYLMLPRYDHPRPIVVKAVEKPFCTLPASTDDDFLVADLEP
jgi:hypothetical protein